MFKIEKKTYGLKMTFEGFVKPDEMQSWLDQFTSAMETTPRGFGILVDMRKLKPLPPESQSLMNIGQSYGRERGLTRSLVVVDSSITALQFKRIAKHTNVAEYERYLDSSSHPNWENIGINWIQNAQEPPAA